MGSPFPHHPLLLSWAGAFFGATLWVLVAIGTDGERALPALLVGGLAGGATRLTPHRARRARLFSVAVAALALMSGQYFVVRNAAISDLVAAGAREAVPLLLSPPAMLNVTFSWLRIYPVDAVVWTASLGLAFLLPAGDPQEQVREPAAAA